MSTSRRAAIFTDLQRETLNASPPPEPREVSEARAAVRRAEAEFFAAQAQLREAIVKRERGK